MVPPTLLDVCVNRVFHHKKHRVITQVILVCDDKSGYSFKIKVQHFKKLFLNKLFPFLLMQTY